MKNSAHAYLMQALGKLPEDSKAGFMQDALRTLHELHAAHAVWRPAPPKGDRDALNRIGKQTARLIDAINSAAETETATMLLRDAWLSLDRMNDETISNPMPVLQRLQQAVTFCLPEQKHAARPLEKTPASTMAILRIAEHFRHHFGRQPTFGSSSPFMRFVREALPAYGLFVPKAVDIRRIAAAV